MNKYLSVIKNFISFRFSFIGFSFITTSLACIPKIFFPASFDRNANAQFVALAISATGAGAYLVIKNKIPKLTKKIPAALIAIVIVAAIVIFGNIEVSTVGSFIKDGGGEGLQGGLPSFQDQIFTLFYTLKGHWGLIGSTALILAAVGLIESLLTLNLIDEITETRGKSNKEAIIFFITYLNDCHANKENKNIGHLT